MCTFLVQCGALWEMGLVHWGICDIWSISIQWPDDVIKMADQITRYHVPLEYTNVINLFITSLHSLSGKHFCLPLGLCKWTFNGFWKTVDITTGHVRPESNAPHARSSKCTFGSANHTTNNGLSYKIHKIADCACAENAGNVFPATDFKGNR